MRPEYLADACWYEEDDVLIVFRDGDEFREFLANAQQIEAELRGECAVMSRVSLMLGYAQWFGEIPRERAEFVVQHCRN